jgi:DNA adenine methylase
MTKPIIGRVGGKSRLAPWIIEHLSRFQWSLYCEPFAGSAAVYFRLIHEGILEGIKARGHHPRCVLNDADSRIVQLFKTCRDYPEALAHAIEFTPYSREEHRLAQTEDLSEVLDDVERSRRTLVDCWQSFKANPGDGWGIARHTDRSTPELIKAGGYRGPEERWTTLPSRILEAARHLKSAYIENDDAVAVIERWATPWTAIYADPPYYDCSHYYKEQFGNDCHARLAQALHQVDAACVIVSYYPHPEILALYSEDDWEYHYRETVASSAGVTRLSKSKTRPKRQELLLVRKQKSTAPKVNLSGQMGLF